MPPLFPGMDPFVEGQDWENFHVRFISALGDLLVASVRPRYVVRAERRVYVEREFDEPARPFRSDVAVLRAEEQAVPPPRRSSSSASLSPAVPTLPIPEEKRETFLTIRELETMEVVTVLEVLFPGNKRSGSDGRREYLRKRETILRSAAHLVELDLLRGGQRLPTVEALPPGDYFALVCRGTRRPSAEVYSWTIREPLPTIPIPLAGDDPDVLLNLQEAFGTVYDRAGYDYSLSYRRPIEPPLAEPDLAWAQAILAAK